MVFDKDTGEVLSHINQIDTTTLGNNIVEVTPVGQSAVALANIQNLVDYYTNIGNRLYFNYTDTYFVIKLNEGVFSQISLWDLVQDRLDDRGVFVCNRFVPLEGLHEFQFNVTDQSVTAEVYIINVTCHTNENVSLRIDANVANNNLSFTYSKDQVDLQRLNDQVGGSFFLDGVYTSVFDPDFILISATENKTIWHKVGGQLDVEVEITIQDATNFTNMTSLGSIQTMNDVIEALKLENAGIQVIAGRRTFDVNTIPGEDIVAFTYNETRDEFDLKVFLD